MFPRTLNFHLEHVETARQSSHGHRELALNPQRLHRGVAGNRILSRGRGPDGNSQ
jgi:hypothetical protein